MVCPNCRTEISDRAAKMKWDETIGRIHELEKAWVVKKMAVKSLVEKIQKLTEEIHDQTTPGDYEEIMAYVEGRFIYKNNRGDVIGVVLERVLLILTFIFTLLLWFFEQFLDKDVFMGSYVLFMCFALVCLAVAAGSEKWHGAHDREKIYYELLYKSMERRHEKRRYPERASPVVEAAADSVTAGEGN